MAGRPRRGLARRADATGMRPRWRLLLARRVRRRCGCSRTSDRVVRRSETMHDEWDLQLAIFRESLVALPQLLIGIAPDRLRRAPTPGEWSPHVVVCHLVLNEMNSAVSLRLILTQDQPVLSEIED